MRHIYLQLFNIIVPFYPHGEHQVELTFSENSPPPLIHKIELLKYVCWVASTPEAYFLRIRLLMDSVGCV